MSTRQHQRLERLRHHQTHRVLRGRRRAIHQAAHATTCQACHGYGAPDGCQACGLVADEPYGRVTP